MAVADSSDKRLPDEKLKPRSITLDSLPPCKVCGCAASGHHYGAVSCEACKSFFRRSFDGHRKYKCRSKSKNGACTIGTQMRCAFCRLQKCRDVGMSKDAIHLGRYTHAQRMGNIVQMKYHKLRIESPRTLSSSTDNPACEQAVDQTISKDTLLESSSTTNTVQSDLIKAIVMANENHNIMFHILKDEEEIAERQLQYYNEYRLKSEMYGPMDPPSWQEFDYFYNLTGLEMDNRVVAASDFTKQLEALGKSAIQFAKAIPGFRDLTLNDQASLLKGGFFEFWVICAYRGVNPELKIAIFVDGTMVGDQDVTYPEEKVYVHKLMEFSKRLHDLHIRKEEDALLLAIVLLSPDRTELEQADAVEKLHWDIVWSLWTLLYQNHQNPSRTFTKIIDCLVSLREMTENDRKFCENLPFDIPEIHSSKLVCELVQGFHKMCIHKQS